MIWVIGGTSDGRAIAQQLKHIGQPFILSVATALGAETYADIGCQIHQGRLDAAGFQRAFESNHIHWVIDASHPHAVEVSHQAMSACKALGLRYTRFLRQMPDHQVEKAVYVESFEAAWQYLSQVEGRIMVTGSKELEKAVQVIQPERLVARVVPCVASMVLCEQAGIPSERIIGLKGPFDEATNRLLIRQYGVQYLLFKESGSGSGFEEKIEAALAEGVTPVIVRLPILEYPETFENIHVLAEALNGNL